MHTFLGGWTTCQKRGRVSSKQKPYHAIRKLTDFITLSACVFVLVIRLAVNLVNRVNAGRDSCICIFLTADRLSAVTPPLICAVLHTLICAALHYA